MSILVTGGAGYIGSHTVIELIQAGYQPIIVDDYSNSSPEVIQRIEQITNYKVPTYTINILDRQALAAVFQAHQIEAVIHFAAFKAVGESVAQPLKYYHNNISGTINLLEVMQEYQVKQIVFSSSATVYGQNHPSPLKESLPVGQATNPYGYSKIVMEQILLDLAKADPDWQITILRYFNPIGAHESGLIGEDPQGNDYPTADGTGVRDYIHVVDLGQGHVRALDQLKNQKGVAIYNLGTGLGYSVLELIRTFAKVNQVEVPYQIVERRPGDVAVSYADPTLAEKELKWKAERGLEEMCRDSWNWQQKNPKGYQAE